jgi:hypothetical protein
MLTPSADILPWLMPFAGALSAPSFRNALVLFCGAILAPGMRTVTSGLQVLGRQQESFSKYHRFFSHASWSPLLLSRLLFWLLVRAFLEPGEPVVILVDEHLERRKSRKIAYRGLFRDPTRSTAEQVQFTWGVRWLVFALLVRVPWSTRRWALPFLLFPLLSEKACQRLKRKHRTVTEWTALLMRRLRRWTSAEMILVGDGTYAAVPLAARCRQLAPCVTLVSRLRLDAALYEFPAPPSPGKRGPKAKKGKRQPKLQDRLTDPHTPWERVQVRWYGQGVRTLEIATGEALWYRSGHPPQAIRWVLVRSPKGETTPIEPGACFCTEPSVPVKQVLEWFLGRWNIEVTFAEVRAHLGFETQRHWSRKAVGRVSPCLFGLFSLVVVIAKELHPKELPRLKSRWYRKEEATFADALAAVRSYLWRALAPLPISGEAGKCANSTLRGDVCLIPTALWQQLQFVACYAR